jgi:hypothetical protein
LKNWRSIDGQWIDLSEKIDRLTEGFAEKSSLQTSLAEMSQL